MTHPEHEVHTDSGTVSVDPQAAAADYYVHDGGTIPGPGPGPFAGDYGAPLPYTNTNARGDLPASYVYPDDMHKDAPITLEQARIDAVNVRVVDTVPKDHSVRFQVTTVTVAAGTCAQVLGKDPTRLRVKIRDTANLTNKNWLARESFNNTALGFMIPRDEQGLDSNAEDNLYILADPSNGATSVISIYAEYIRSDNTRAETYMPE